MGISNRKKILVINQHYSVGGIKKSLENLLPILMEKYELQVLFISGNLKEFDRKFPGIRKDAPFLLSSMLSSFEDIMAMNYKLARFVIKLIFLIMTKFISGEKIINIAVDLSSVIGKYDCVISYAHDNWLNNGSFFGGGNRLAVKKTIADNKISWLHGEPQAIGLNAERLFNIYREFNRVVVVSDAVKAQFERLSKGMIKCERIYNLIDIEEINRKSKDVIYEPNSTVFKIVTVGRLSKFAKRIDKINEIAKLLKNRGDSFRWTVVGGGSEYETCVGVAKEYGLSGIVEYVGMQENPYKFMKESDLFVLVSDSEAMSMVIKESMILGTPVLTTDFPAARESIIDGVTGFITGKDVNELYNKIAFCIENRELLNSVRANIKKKPFNNEESIKDIYKIIGE